MKHQNHNICIDSGYKTLKEARIAARETAVKYSSGYSYTKYIDIYQEPNGTYSVNGYLNGKAEYIMTVDKAGIKYKWQVVRRKDGAKSKELIKL